MVFFKMIGSTRAMGTPGIGLIALAPQMRWCQQAFDHLAVFQV